jgi:hypothetical protein
MLPLTPLAVILTGVWIVLHGIHGVTISTTLTLIFGIVIIVLAASDYVRSPGFPLARRP